MIVRRDIFFSILIIFILVSCKAHFIDELDNHPQGYADSQVIGSWKITAVSSDVANDWNGDGIKETNIYATWSACQKDNLYAFSADKSGSFKLTCSTTDSGSWQIINTQYLFYSSPTIGTESEKMIAMTSAEFKTTKNYTLSNGQPATVTKTWTRQ